MNTSIGRRELLSRGLQSLGLCILPRTLKGSAESPPPLPSPPTLRLYTWAGYFKPELLSSFAADHDCRIQVSTFGSNEELLVNLEADKNLYDLVTPSVYSIGMLRRGNLLSPLDPSMLANRQFIEKEHLNSTADPQNEWSVPFAFSVSGIGYLEGEHQPRLFSWRAFDEPLFYQRFTLLDDMREVLGAALKSLGKSVNCASHSDLAAAQEVADRWIKNARRLQSEDYRVNLTQEVDRLAHGYCGDFLHRSERSVPAQFFIPEEGAPTTCDHFCLTANSENKRLAHEFINFFCLPHIAAQNMEWSGFRSAIGEARSMLPPTLREHPTLFPAPEILARCEPLQDLGDSLPLYEKAWGQLVCG